jgi:hypothetical protein
MPKYLISWTEETWYNTTVEAESAEKAEEMFYANEGDCWSRAKEHGSELQDSVEVEELL